MLTEVIHGAYDILNGKGLSSRRDVIGDGMAVAKEPWTGVEEDAGRIWADSSQTWF